MSDGGVWWLTHRAAYTIARGPIPAGLVVRHKCDRPCCVNFGHLELGTHADNMADRRARNKPQDRATPPIVRDIKAGYDGTKASMRDLAKRHGLAFLTVWNILKGYTWRHIVVPDAVPCPRVPIPPKDDRCKTMWEVWEVFGECCRFRRWKRGESRKYQAQILDDYRARRKGIPPDPNGSPTDCLDPKTRKAIRLLHKQYPKLKFGPYSKPREHGRRKAAAIPEAGFHPERSVA
jgi:hypothetical protein